MSEINEHPAHIVKNESGERVQTLREHVEAVAKYASDKLCGMGLGSAAYLAGLLHDMGKATRKYRDYINRAANGEEVVRGSVNHTFAAVIYINERLCGEDADDLSRLTGDILSYAVGAHHGQFDCVGIDEKNGFEYRLSKNRDEIFYDEAVRNFTRECASEEELKSLFDKARAELQALHTRIHDEIVNRTQINFCDGMCARILLSAVIDGDRRDTAEFEQGEKFEFTCADEALWSRELDAVERRLDAFGDKDKPINIARRAFSDECAAFRGGRGGIYRVNIPTGGGKTMSTLRCALTQAKLYGKKRLFFVIPLLTVIEQNCAVIRGALTDDSIVTEHHSNIIRPRDDREELSHNELLCETWENPIIITTLVQLLSALFGGKTSQIRRMSALSDSVIIIDEVQSLPVKLVDMFDTAMNFLAYFCGAQIILSSATHPCFELGKHPMKYSENADIIQSGKALFEVFRRTDIKYEVSKYGMSCDELAQYALDKLGGAQSMLVVCNTKKSAKAVFKNLSSRRDKDYEVYHLSTSMCMQHRRDTIKKITSALERRSEGVRVICVSTQLIEAGVDISFGGAIRVLCGLDSIIQSAGRCNRSGEYGTLREVDIVKLTSDNADLSHLFQIKQGAKHTSYIIDAMSRNPKLFGGDIASEKSIKHYYSTYIGELAKLDITSYKVHVDNQDKLMYNLISDNYKRDDVWIEYRLSQAFKTAGDAFTVFDEDTVDVIVPYNAEARKIIADLSDAKAMYDIKYAKALINAAKPYTISLFRRAFDDLSRDGIIYTNERLRYSALNIDGYYDMETGLNEEGESIM